MISKFYPDWKEVMSHKSDKGVGGIEDLLNELSNEAPRVFAAVKALEHQIFNGIQDRSLVNGRHITTTVLDKLNSNERHRVLASIFGRYFENQASHTQYKVVKDGARIALLQEEMAAQHICVPPPR
jgi:hypothetical protein